MLTSARIAAIVPVSDVEAAVHFYGDTLGLAERAAQRPAREPGGRVRGGRRDAPRLRERRCRAEQAHGRGLSGRRHRRRGPTLRERGVAFEEYDLPDLKTENGIADVGDVNAAWCKDPDGNILAFESVGLG